MRNFKNSSAVLSGMFLVFLMNASVVHAGACQGSTDPRLCQYKVDASTTAPSPLDSEGIYHGNAVTNVLYNLDIYNICRYIDNHNAHDIFVPQGIKGPGDFSAFINHPPKGIFISYCVMPTTITASATTSASYEITGENGMMVNAIGTLPSITDIPVPGDHAISRYLTPSQTVTVSTDRNGKPITFISDRSDCDAVNGHTLCNKWYIKEVQTITLQIVGNSQTNADNFSYTWGHPAVTSQWFQSANATGPWRRIKGPNRNYIPPAHCPTPYVSGSSWNTTITEDFPCPPGFTGTYTQTVTTPYYCQPDGSSKAGMPLITNNQPTMCQPIVNGVCGAANGVATVTAPTTDLCSTPYPASSVTLDTDKNDPGAASEWVWTCPGSLNGGNSVSCAASAPTQPSDPKARSEGFGLNINEASLYLIKNNQAVLFSAYLNVVSQSGSGWVRVPATWREIEPTQGKYNWGLLDNDIAALSKLNLNILLNIRGTPCWARADQKSACYDQATQEHYAGSQLPDRAQWQKFVTDLVNHYRGQISYYEIWNEANNSASLDVNGAASDSPEQLAGYRDYILVPAAQAAHQADPSIRIVGPTFTPFVTKTVDEIVSKFAILLGGEASQAIDVVSIHIYPASELISFGQAVRQAMQTAGMAGKPLWLTEFGYSVGSDTPTASQLEAQKQYLLQLLQANQNAHVFDKTFWFATGDNDIFGGGWGGGHDGLVNNDLTPRPSYKALQNYIQTGTLN